MGYGKYFPTYLDGSRVTSRTLSRLLNKAKWPRYSTHDERVEAFDALSRVRLTGVTSHVHTKTHKHFVSEWNRILDVIDPPDC